MNGPVVEGSAFSRPAKAFAGGLIGYLLYALVQVLGKVELADVPATAMAFIGLALACVLFTYYWILVSRTRVDAGQIQQTWYGTKTVRIADITKIKFISIPYLEWLIAPRIVVQVSGRGSYTFYAADRNVMQVFAKLSMGLL